MGPRSCLRLPAALLPLGVLVALLSAACADSAAPQERRSTAAPSTRPSTSPTTTSTSVAKAATHRCDGNTLFRAGSPTAVRCRTIERCDPQAGRCVPACSDGEVYVPPTGPQGFIMGAGLQKDFDRPHKVVLSEPFCMDATEVTAEAYVTCVRKKKCTPSKWYGRWTTGRVRRATDSLQPTEQARLPKHPINHVNWRQARTYCELVGKSLPTEAQWEWAATGGDGRKWAWGNEPPDCERADFTEGILSEPAPDAGCHGGGPSPVGSHPKGAKKWPNGAIHDLSGNVWEWCLDSYGPHPADDQTDPVRITPGLEHYVVRGGGWNRSAEGIRLAYRASGPVSYQVPGLGFRCVRNANKREKGLGKRD